MTHQIPAYTADIAERAVRITWPDNERGGATPPPDDWQDRAWAQESTLHEIDEGSVSGCSILRWRDDPRSDAELLAVSLALVTGKPAPSAEPEPAAVSAAVAPPTQAAPSLRAGLRDEIVKALGRITTVPPVAHRREQADHVLAVLYREWPWLRAEAEDAEPTDRAAVLREAADRFAAFDLHAEAAALRRMADETATQTPDADLTESERKMLAYALDQAQEHIWSRDGFTDEDQAAVDSLRRMADETATETPPADTLPAWLYQRFMPDGIGWDQLDEDDRSHWQHQARAVRRAVARGGFKQPAAGARQDGARP